jgi:hypothetical protein
VADCSVRLYLHADLVEHVIGDGVVVRAVARLHALPLPQVVGGEHLPLVIVDLLYVYRAAAGAQGAQAVSRGAGRDAGCNAIGAEAAAPARERHEGVAQLQQQKD